MTMPTSTRLFALAQISLLTTFVSQTAWAQNSVASQETTITGGTLAMVAYIVLWVLISGTIFTILKHQRNLTKEMDGLRQRMDHVLGLED